MIIQHHNFMIFISFTLAFIVVLGKGNTIGGSIDEMVTCSKYHFEERVLEKLVRIEHSMELTQTQMKKLEERIDEKLRFIDDENDKRSASLKYFQKQIEKGFRTQQNDLRSVMDNFTSWADNITNDLIDKHDTLLQAFGENSAKKLALLNDNDLQRNVTFGSLVNKMDIDMNNKVQTANEMLNTFQFNASLQLKELDDQANGINDTIFAQFQHTTTELRKAFDENLANKLAQLNDNNLQRNATFGHLVSQMDVVMNSKLKTVDEMVNAFHLNASLQIQELKDQTNAINDTMFAHFNNTSIAIRKELGEKTNVTVKLLESKEIQRNLSFHSLTMTLNSILNKKVEEANVLLNDIKSNASQLHFKLSDNQNTINNTLQTHLQNVRDQHCLNNGTGIRGVASDYCRCQKGFLGKDCELSDGTATEIVMLYHEVNTVSSMTPEVMVATRKGTTLSIRYFSSNNDINIKMDRNSPRYALSNSIIMRGGTSRYKRGALIRSDIPIRFYGFIFYRNVCEGYLAIPTQFLSLHYIIPSFKIFADQRIYGSSFGISSIIEGTIVTVKLKMKAGSVSYNGIKYSNNQVLTIKLSQYESFQLENSYDITGTEVYSSQPVAVVSGSKCNAIKNSNSNCQPFIEMLLPTNQLDNMYLVPILKYNTVSTVRVLAVKNTVVTYYNGTKSITLKPREFVDIIHYKLSYIHTTDDVMVMIYPHEVKGRGDAFMMTIPGVNQYLYEYEFVVPDHGFESYISLTVPTHALTGIIVDGYTITTSTYINITESGHQFSSLTLRISSGYHRLTHDHKERFGLWVYGYYKLDAYGFPAGIAFKT